VKKEGGTMDNKKLNKKGEKNNKTLSQKIKMGVKT
jgi:hypothetical protein